MNLLPTNIIPITKARNKLSSLTEALSDKQVIILTKGGEAKAALVDIDYLTKLQQQIQKLYKKTYIDPSLLPFTREFSDKEILEWEKEDSA